MVHHGTGTPIGFGPALLRSLVLGVAGLPTFGIGLATLAWTAVEDRGRQRRGWHDHLTNTVVVDVRPVVEVADTAVDEGPRHIVNLTAMRLVPAPAVEQVRTPERTEHSMRRQPLPADLAGPAATPAPPHPAPSQPAPSSPLRSSPLRSSPAAARSGPAPAAARATAAAAAGARAAVVAAAGGPAGPGPPRTRTRAGPAAGRADDAASLARALRQR